MDSEQPLYKRDLLKNHAVRVYRPPYVKPGGIVRFSNKKYQKQADGSLKLIAELKPKVVRKLYRTKADK